jgi:hypothetical protein
LFDRWLRWQPQLVSRPDLREGRVVLPASAVRNQILHDPVADLVE